jgi:predicted ATPase
MPGALARHDALVCQAIATHHGVVFKTTGDGVHAALESAPDALAAALAAQRALQTEAWAPPGPLRARMALHTGVAEERDGDYFGPALNRMARLLATGHGGQILVSRATHELVCDHLPPDVALRDLGVHYLKDLARPEHIFQLIAADLPTDFPPLETLDRHPNNLPVQPTPLIGRDAEVASLCSLLRRSDVCLVTLSGPGGVGKTRLALQVAAELLDDFDDGAYFVDLAPIGEVALVAPTIAQTLGVRETGNRRLLDSLKDYLREKQVLLVLDNFEHVVAAAPVVAEVLAAAPRLSVLVTSRVALHLRGEKEVVASPLALPDPQRLPPLAVLSQYAAVELFIERALDVQPNFAVTNENAPAVAEVCYRLDGLPLAIELAAARIKLFAPQTLLARLEKRLPLLTGGARDLPTRQQTLRNTIDWSYELLNAGEQTLFRRLAVFVGGCTLEAAQVICNVEGELAWDVVDGLAALLDQSLVQQGDGPDGEPRFTMLETIREYALEQLEAHSEADAVRRRHAEYYLALAETAQPQFQRAERYRWSERTESEHYNLRAALAWALEGGDVEIGGRLAVALAGSRSAG